MDMVALTIYRNSILIERNSILLLQDLYLLELTPTFWNIMIQMP